MAGMEYPQKDSVLRVFHGSRFQLDGLAGLADAVGRDINMPTGYEEGLSQGRRMRSRFVAHRVPRAICSENFP